VALPTPPPEGLLVQADAAKSQLRSRILHRRLDMLNALGLRWRNLFACAAIRLGWPCVVRPCEYRSSLASVSVKCTDLFTVVTVNGVQVFFQRGTGTFDGVGVHAPD